MTFPSLSSCAYSLSMVRSLRRALCSRLITVPIGMSSTFATSLYANSSTSVRSRTDGTARELRDRFTQFVSNEAVDDLLPRTLAALCAQLLLTRRHPVRVVELLRPMPHLLSPILVDEGVGQHPCKPCLEVAVGSE